MRNGDTGTGATDVSGTLGATSPPAMPACAPLAPLPPRVPVLLPDDKTTELHARTVGPGYELGPFLGRGGTAVVFEATHPDHPQRFAVKVLVDKRLHTTRAFAATYEQARAIADLRSPHVVRMYDAGRTASGEPYIVMEHLDGDDLAQHIRDHGGLPIKQAVRFALQICYGLAEVHAAGLVHEDVKPSNLVLTRGDEGDSLKIIDFGTSVPAENPEERLVTGSPGYASPEQLDGQIEVDARADIWAVGIVIYELVTGKRAFDARTLAEAVAAVKEAPPTMTSPHGAVPPELETIVRCCLEHDRAKRFPTIADLGAALTVLAARLVKPEGAASTTMASAGSPPSGPSGAPSSSVSLPIASRPDPARMAPTVVTRSRDWSKTRRTIVLAAIGPLCALATMTAVRLALASPYASGLRTAHAASAQVAAKDAGAPTKPPTSLR